jgi:hypothetical protein
MPCFKKEATMQIFDKQANGRNMKKGESLLTFDSTCQLCNMMGEESQAHLMLRCKHLGCHARMNKFWNNQIISHYYY